jgi:hypothetical protein
MRWCMSCADLDYCVGATICVLVMQDPYVRTQNDTCSIDSRRMDTHVAWAAEAKIVRARGQTTDKGKREQGDG